MSTCLYTACTRGIAAVVAEIVTIQPGWTSSEYSTSTFAILAILGSSKAILFLQLHCVWSSRLLASAACSVGYHYSALQSQSVSVYEPYMHSHHQIPNASN